MGVYARIAKATLVVPSAHIEPLRLILHNWLSISETRLYCSGYLIDAFPVISDRSNVDSTNHHFQGRAL